MSPKEQIWKELTSFQPRLTKSPWDRPDPEKSRVNTVMFEGRSTIAASLPSGRHPLINTREKYEINTLTLWQLTIPRKSKVDDHTHKQTKNTISTQIKRK